MRFPSGLRAASDAGAAGSSLMDWLRAPDPGYSDQLPASVASARLGKDRRALSSPPYSHILPILPLPMAPRGRGLSGGWKSGGPSSVGRGAR
jgi:hypothetical protein